MYGKNNIILQLVNNLRVYCSFMTFICNAAAHLVLLPWHLLWFINKHNSFYIFRKYNIIIKICYEIRFSKHYVKSYLNVQTLQDVQDLKKKNSLKSFPESIIYNILLFLSYFTWSRKLTFKENDQYYIVLKTVYYNIIYSPVECFRISSRLPHACRRNQLI